MSKQKSKKSSFSHETHLNHEIAEKENKSFWQSIKDRSTLLRTKEQERLIENRILDSHWNSESLHFRGALDGVTHYLIWLMVFIMPVFVPYFEKNEELGGGKTPSLFLSTIVYVLLAPLLCVCIYKLVDNFNSRKAPLSERFLLGAIFTLVLFGVYLLFCKFNLLPKMIYESNTDDQRAGIVSVWFSSFSNGKFFFTYVTTILATAAFILQQIYNRNHLVFRFPLRKIIAAFFIVHLVALAYPLMYPEKSMLHESLMRFHQWIQYFLIFLIVVNSMTSLGRILSIAKASSISGTVVAFTGIAQFYFTKVYTKKLPDGSDFTVTESFIFYNKAEHQPFGTFGHNNFAAAYVCLATPITIALIGGLLSKKFSKDGSSSHSNMPLISFMVMLLLQFIYLSISVGKAGIVSMVIAIAICCFIFPVLIKGTIRNQIVKIGLISVLAAAGTAGIAGIALMNLPKSAQKIESLGNKWAEKFKSSFDIRQGSNRVRLSYVGGALQLSKISPDKPHELSALHLLAGVGPNNYKYHYPRLRDPEEANIEKGKHVLQSHCDFAQFAADTGVMGFFIFGLLIVYPIYAGIALLSREENTQRRLIGLGFLCTLISMGVNALFFFPFQTPGSLLPYFISLGLLFSYDRKGLINSTVLKATFVTVFLLGLVFYSYEAWYTTRLNPDTFFSQLKVNLFIVIAACSIIYIAYAFLENVSKKWSAIIVIKSNPIALSIIFAAYVAFSHFYSLSYIYTDYIKQAFINPQYRWLEDLYVHSKKSPDRVKQGVTAANGSRVRKFFEGVQEQFAKSIAINPRNPDIYQLMATSITYYTSVASLAFESRVPGDSVNFNAHKLNRLKYLEKAHQYWPMNRDLFNQLAIDNMNLVGRSKGHAQRQYLIDSKNWAKKSLKIYANEADIFNMFLHSIKLLGATQEFNLFYESDLKNNFFLYHSVNSKIASFFKETNQTEKYYETIVKDFVAYPDNANAIYSAHQELKKKTKNGKHLYPRGIADLMNYMRWDGKTVFEYLTTDRHHYMRTNALNAVLDLLIRENETQKAIEIQNWYLGLRIKSMDLKSQKNLRSRMNAKESIEDRLRKITGENERFVKKCQLIDTYDNMLFILNAFLTKPTNDSKRAAKAAFSSFIQNHPLAFFDHLDDFKSIYSRLNMSLSLRDFVLELRRFERIKSSNDQQLKLIDRYIANKL